MVRAETPEERLLFRPQLCSFDMTRPDGLHFFTASLSASADSLPQWQAYGSGGYGVALGFDGPELLKVTLRDNLVPGFGIGLTRVIYDNADQRSWFEYSVDEWFSRAAEVVVATRGRILNQGWLLSGLFSHLLTCTSEYFPSIKAAHFRHENEWRLGHGHLASVGADIVRRRGEKSVPYIELDLRVSGKLPLVSFTLGPGFRSEAALHTFRKLVAQLQYEHVTVASSEIPLRIEQREWAVQ